MPESKTPRRLTAKPSTATRTDHKCVPKLCHEIDDSILSTDNGENDPAAMRNEAFCGRAAWCRLQMKLASADRQIRAGNLSDHADVMARLRQRINPA